jgi:heme oxygenase (mycobilin-producing)
MAVKILIKRRMPKGFTDPRFNALIRQLRALAIVRQGYISGETLKGIDDPQDYLVISTWQSKDAWNAWCASRERAEIQEQIDTLLGVPTKYEMYEYR